MGDETIDRSKLLPRSGVGVEAPWLVIAPAGSAVIGLDLRVLDRVEIRPDEENVENVENVESDEEWQHDRCCEVLISLGDLEVALYISDGREAAERIVREAAPLTREAANTAIIRGRVAAPVIGPLVFSTDPSGRPVDIAPVGHGKLVVLSSTNPYEPTPQLDRLAGMELELTRPQMIIGRTDENDLVIDHRSISRDHASVTRDPETGRYTISDLQSTNGVRVNGQEHRQFELRHDDIVDLGHVRTRFVEPGKDFVITRNTPRDSGDLLIGRDAPPDLDRFLMIDRDVVMQRGEYIQVGAVAFRTEEVREYAELGANLPLSGGRVLQAAMAMLVVAAAERDTASP